MDIVSSFRQLVPARVNSATGSTILGHARIKVSPHLVRITLPGREYLEIEGATFVHVDVKVVQTGDGELRLHFPSTWSQSLIPSNLQQFVGREPELLFEVVSPIDLNIRKTLTKAVERYLAQHPLEVGE
jgi:hypothetical protein